MESESKYWKYRDSYLKSGRKYRLNHPDKIKKIKANYLRRIRQEILTFLGNKCIRCGEIDWRCLQIDHVHGDGFIDRPNNKTNSSYYLKVLRKIREGSNDYQCLCANCNCKKKYDENEIWRHFKHD